MNPKRQLRGFTLIELLIVIAIIGILASIVLVSLSQARTNARFASLKATAVSVGRAMEACKLEGGTINAPASGTGGNNICSLGSQYGTYPELPEGTTWVLRTYNAGDGTAVAAGAGGDPSAIPALWAGHYPHSTWATYCNAGNTHTGLCAIYQGYSGAARVSSDPWK